MSTNRWVLHDPVTNASWTMPINPDSMDRSAPSRSMTNHRSVRTDRRVRTFVGAPGERNWSWGGVIRTKAHYDALLEWAEKRYAVEVTDHLGLTFRVYIDSFEPTDRRPNIHTPWRLRYTMTAKILEGPL